MNAELAAWIGHLGETATRCDEYRRQVMMSNQESVNPNTEQTYNVMVFERELVLPMQAVIGSPTEYFVTNSDDLIYVVKKSPSHPIKVYHLDHL